MLFMCCPEISSDLHPETHLLSIAACLPIEQIARFFSGGITRVVPSLTAKKSSGVTLLCHNTAVTPSVTQETKDLFASVDNVVEIDEENPEVASDHTRCGPALMAVLIDEFARSATRHSTLTPEPARAPVIPTLSGTAWLPDERGYSLETILHRGATPGGITEEGAKQLQSDMPLVYDTLIQRTLDKRDLVKKNVRNEVDRMPDQKP
jgi:pyrroline-5-carboxylate reductase